MSRFMVIKWIISRLQKLFDPKLLKPEYRKKWSQENPTYGFCYIGSETLYHLFAKDLGYVPMNARDDRGISHWWLEKETNRIDPTADQYYYENREPPYVHGTHRSFLTNQPSKRSKILINALEDIMIKESSVEKIYWSQAAPWIKERHYAKRAPTGNAYGLFIDGVIYGVCTYSSMIPNVAASVCGEEYSKHVLELSRLIIEEGMPPNTLSNFVARTFKLLEPPKIIVSYSDRNQHHTGYIYQALNFIYTGLGGDSREFIMNGKQVSTRPEGLRKWMKNQSLEYDPELTIAENVEKFGGEVIKITTKHRYVYFVGDKRQKKTLQKALKWPVVNEYPKEEVKHYDINERVKQQAELVTPKDDINARIIEMNR